MVFEWDYDKAESNISKHNVTFRIASTVFEDLRRTEAYDLDHSTEEERRYITTGLTAQGLVTVVYTCRGEIIRIISARKATIKEKNDYLGGSYL